LQSARSQVDRHGTPSSTAITRTGSQAPAPHPSFLENALAKPPNYKQEKKRREDAQKKRNEAKQREDAARKENAARPPQKP
jgi:hypothetical protein